MQHKFETSKKTTNNFHNLQGYDEQIIVDIDVIPKGIDKYMGIIFNRHITFIYSLKCYIGSLDTLASNLKDEDFKHLI